MHHTSSTSRLLVSAAAATRFFLMIASMPVSAVAKGSLMVILSDVIEGRRPVAEGDFSVGGIHGEKLFELLVKAISRSAKARAAAARRRSAATVQTVTDTNPGAPVESVAAFPEAVVTPEADEAKERSRVAAPAKRVRWKVKHRREVSAGSRVKRFHKNLG